MQTIWKYPLTSTTHLSLPKGAVVLSAAGQNDQVCLWIQLDADTPFDTRRTFIFHGTGHPINDEGLDTLRFIGTAHIQGSAFHIRGSALVFHVFEKIKPMGLGAHNESVLRQSMGPGSKRTGILCDACGLELIESNPGQVLQSHPPQYEVHCDCGFNGYRY